MHTPGPWRLWPHRERTNPIVCVGNDPLTYSGIATVMGENMADDARLIMAAPELLAACKMLLPMAESYLRSAPSHPDNAKLEDARAAIAAAESHS